MNRRHPVCIYGILVGISLSQKSSVDKDVIHLTWKVSPTPRFMYMLSCAPHVTSNFIYLFPSSCYWPPVYTFMIMINCTLTFNVPFGSKFEVGNPEIPCKVNLNSVNKINYHVIEINIDGYRYLLYLRMTVWNFYNTQIKVYRFYFTYNVILFSTFKSQRVTYIFNVKMIRHQITHGLF